MTIGSVSGTIKLGDVNGVRDVDLCAKGLSELSALVEEASRRGIADAHSAALATADKDGKPSVRTVYITAFEDGGVVFFVNSQSGKGRQLAVNPQAALCFFWPGLQKQVLLDGKVEIMSEADSDTYWKRRSRESQLGAWASEQSKPLVDKEQLKTGLGNFKSHFDYRQAPRHEHWRAYLLRPDRIELWSTGWQRLLARTRYERDPSGNWTEFVENP